MFLRRLRDVTKKISFLRYARDVLRTPHKRHTGPEYFWLKIFSSNTLFWMLVLPLTTFFKELMVGLLIFLTSLAAFKRFSAITHPATGPPGDVVPTSLLSPSNVVGTSQMKHPTTSQWNVAKTCQWFVSQRLIGMS